MHLVYIKIPAVVNIAMPRLNRMLRGSAAVLSCSQPVIVPTVNKVHRYRIATSMSISSLSPHRTKVEVETKSANISLAVVEVVLACLLCHNRAMVSLNLYVLRDWWRR